MNLLAIETATETCSVALVLGTEMRERYEHAPRKHAELLLPWVQQLMAEAGIGFSSLDGIAFSRGPGSFTSLRIGIGIVQGLAWAADRPVIPVSSLAATAQAAVEQGVTSALVALDARMDEVFTGAFAVNDHGIMIPTGQERVCSPENVQLAEQAGTIGVGIGFARYEALQELSPQLQDVKPDIWPRASSVISLAQAWLRDHDALPADQAQPVYLRDNVARKSQQSAG